MTLDVSSPLVVAALTEDLPRKAREAGEAGADAVEVRIDMYEGERYRTLLQNAETIKLVTPDGPVAVTELEEEDEVRLYIEEGGRHFGTKVEESVVEK